MLKQLSIVPLAALIFGSVAFAQQSAAPSSSAAPPPAAAQKICQTVVGAEPGEKPHLLCLTKPEWDAKKIVDAKDATRIVCHYEEQSGTRFRSTKVCMTAAEWENQRLIERQNIEKMQ